jgi:hypothetical protein
VGAVCVGCPAMVLISPSRAETLRERAEPPSAVSGESIAVRAGRAQIARGSTGPVRRLGLSPLALVGLVARVQRGVGSRSLRRSERGVVRVPARQLPQQVVRGSHRRDVLPPALPPPLLRVQPRNAKAR